MGCSLVITLAAFLVAGYCVPVARGSDAEILLESVDNNTIYKLNQDILGKISELQGPIRVVAAVGNAMVGKSTTLNLVELAVRLAEAMNNDSWPDFANVYDAVERNICKRSHVKLIEPLFALMKTKEIEAKSGDALEAFKLECELEDEIVAAQEDLRRITEERRKAEELEEKAKEAESERLAAEKRHEEQEKKFQHELSIKDNQIAKVKREKEEAERKERYLKQLHDEQLKTIALLQRELSRKSSSWLYLKQLHDEVDEQLSKKSSSLFDIVVPIAVGVAIVISDRELKLNITTLPHSPYNVIGLEGACWKWNKIAEKTIGLTGEECGVIAQEVKKLYPLAVTRGKDGYLMVRYGLLHEMINNQHTKNCAPEC